MDGWGWTMMSFGIVFWIAVLALAFWAIREWSGRRDPRQHAEESPREILDRRLASGEIDLDAYTGAVEALSRRNPPAAG